MAVVTIIGAGMMGSALAFPARENGHTVRLVGTPLDREIVEECLKTQKHPKLPVPFPEGLEYYQIEGMETAIQGADMIIGGVSSFGVDWFGEYVLPRIPVQTSVITVTKGLMDTPEGALLTYPHVWQQRLKEKGIIRSICAIGGPCTSYELAQHDQTHVAFCGEDMTVLRKLRDIMQTDYYHISLSTDVTGIESAVALKNGYALAVSLTIGVNQAAFGIDSVLHYNSQAAVFGQSLREMQKLLKLQGAEDPTNLLIGIGDLYVTVYGGRTRLIGILLGRGLSMEEAMAELSGVTLESLVVAKRVARAIRIAAQQGRTDLADYPLMLHVDEIISQDKPVNIPWDTFTFTKE